MKKSGEQKCLVFGKEADEKNWSLFTDWWMTPSSNIAEKLYGKQAEENAKKIEAVAPKEELNEDGFITNLYMDELEKLAWKHQLHLN